MERDTLMIFFFYNKYRLNKDLFCVNVFLIMGGKELQGKNYMLDIVIFLSFLIMGFIPMLFNVWISNLVVGGILAVIFSVIGFIIFRYMFIFPIRELNRCSQAVLEGDLTQGVNVKAVGVLKHLAQTIERMTESLRNLVIKIKYDSRNLTEAASGLATAADTSDKAIKMLANTFEQVAASTQEQSANIEELQSAIEEITSSMEEIAASAQQASAVATSAIRTSKNGVDAVHRVAEQLAVVENQSNILQNTIEKLEYSSKQITEMIMLITHMADQTNLLALNAAIEAARAGEYGRGFAIVADEVRKLAEESANAAKRIGEIVSGNEKETKEAANIISQLREQVTVSKRLSNQAEEALSVIMQNTEEIDKSSANIAAAVEQQSEATQIISQSVEVISSAAQQVAASSQEANAVIEEQVTSSSLINSSSSNLQTLAEELENLIGTFKTDMFTTL